MRVEIEPNPRDLVQIIGVGEEVGQGSILRIDNLRPNPFNPDKDHRMLITYHVDVPCTHTVTVTDSNKQVLLTLYGPRDLPAGTNVIRWSGADNHGNLLSAGNYYIRIALGNCAGGGMNYIPITIERTTSGGTGSPPAGPFPQQNGGGTQPSQPGQSGPQPPAEAGLTSALDKLKKMWYIPVGMLGLTAILFLIPKTRRMVYPEYEEEYYE